MCNFSDEKVAFVDKGFTALNIRIFIRHDCLAIPSSRTGARHWRHLPSNGGPQFVDMGRTAIIFGIYSYSLF